MDSVYTKFFTGNSRYNNLSRSGSLPLFNTVNQGGRLPSCLTYNSNSQDKPFVSPDILKMQMMEERLKELEKQKYRQNEQINTLMSYQMNQNRLNRSASTILLPVSQQPFLLTANNIVQPLNYANNLNRYYNLQRYQESNFNPLNRTMNGAYDYNNKDKNSIYVVSKTSMDDDEFYRKQKQMHKFYKKNIESIKDYLYSDKMDERINRNLHQNFYLPIKNDINNLMEEINYNVQKKMENDNNVINNNLNAVQSNYDQIRYLLQDKIDKMELKQKIDFENLKSEFQQSSKNKEREENIFNNSIMQMKMIDLENRKKKMSEHIQEELKKQREIDEMRHKKELDELRRKHEMEDLENKRMIEEIRFQKMKDNLFKQLYKTKRQPQVYPMIQQMPFPFIYPIPNNNDNYGKSGDDLFKLFMMKSILGNELFPSRKKKKVKYRYFINRNSPYHYVNLPNIQNKEVIMEKRYSKNPNESVNMSNIETSKIYSKHHKHKSSYKSKKSESVSNYKSHSISQNKKDKKKSSKESKSEKKTDEKSKKDHKKKKDEEKEGEKVEDENEEDENEEDENEEEGEGEEGENEEGENEEGENEEGEEGEGGEDEENEGGEEDDEEGNEGEEEEDGEAGEEDDEGE